MGLGKTLALIIMTKKDDTGRLESPSPSLLYTAGTLVVAPLTLVKMWEQEIESKGRAWRPFCVCVPWCSEA